MDKINFVINIILFFSITNAENTRMFPKTFSFGAGSSAYQIEGAWNEEGKSENIWDRWIHEDPSRIENNDTADVASDMYNNSIDQGIYATISKIRHYQFSLPWTRILPSGFTGEPNIKAIARYQELIRLLKRFNITTVATLYYYDLPQSLQAIGGWTNPSIADYFADYARVCFQFFPDVDYWITFYDPRSTCRRGYGDGTFAPGVKSDGVGEYLCSYTILKAHAAAYHVYKEEFEDLKGKVSMAIDLQWSESASTDDADAVDRRNAFEFGLYANPIYKGNWPQEVIERVDFRSQKENFTKSRLPKFTDDEIYYIKGTSDFMAVNLFYVNIVADVEEAKFGIPGYEKDMKAKAYLNSNWNLAVNEQPIVPWSARKALSWLSSSFNNPEIFITGNGIPDVDYPNDSTRISYLRDYLNAILDAIIEDGVKVFGYTAYSLFDSFEWIDGYSYKFGFLFDSEDHLVKIFKDSLSFYQEVIDTLTIPEDDTTTITTTTETPTTPDSAASITLCHTIILTSIVLFNLL